LNKIILLFISVIVFNNSLVGYDKSEAYVSLTTKVYELTKNIKDNEKKCINIAKWIAENICNHGSCDDKVVECKNTLDWFIYRNGICGAKSRLFVEMCRIANIKARVFNLYNFGCVGCGHTVAQAYYNNNWHYFDPTYAGYFKANGNILSWKEIYDKPDNAISHMVVFSGTCDIDIDYGNKIDNKKRMKLNYTPKNIKSADTGFFRSDIIWLTAKVDLKKIPIKIGSINNNFSDVTKDGINQKVSEQLGVSLGTGTDMFHTKWKMYNAKVGKKYAITYHIYRANQSDLRFYAKGKNVEILSGSTYITTKKHLNGLKDQWKIVFISNSKSVEIDIAYDFREQHKLLFVDMIEISDYTYNEFYEIKEILKIRDNVRSLIGRWNKDNLDFAQDNTLFKSIKKMGNQASASCGVMSFALEKLLHDENISAYPISLYWVEKEKLEGHTLIQVDLKDNKKIIVDGHAGIVWQDIQGNLASAYDIGCQVLKYGNDYKNWDFYPSIHGKQYKLNMNLFNYTLDYLAFNQNVYPVFISAIGFSRPTENKNNFSLYKLFIFKSKYLDTSEIDFLIKTIVSDPGYKLEDVKIEYIDIEDCKKREK